MNKNRIEVATTAVTSLMMLPRRLLGGKGHVAPSEKLNILGSASADRGEAISPA